MNKIININLGGKAFAIDDNAFQYLQNYIGSLKSYFSSYEEQNDIIYDIESRLGEIFEERMLGRSIINYDDVEQGISQMGTPEDFAAEDNSEKQSSKHRIRENRFKNSDNRNYKVGKKLLRDMDNKRIAGVCGGLTQYFGLKKALYVRLLFVLLLFMGLSPMVYIVLWVLMPKPKTAADRLAMKGKEVNYNNIAKEVTEEFNDLKDRLSNIGR